MKIKRVATLRNAETFRTHLEEIGASLPFDETLQSGPDAALAQKFLYRDRVIGNRFAVLPMEGWDGTTDGNPTELTKRRWDHFGVSGAKLIWGGEAVSVRPDGRANPRQLMMLESTLPEIIGLRERLIKAHAAQHGQADDMLIGLQLTHSGRFARPYDNKKMEPRILYSHPILNPKFNLADDAAIMTDDEIDQLIDDFVKAAVLVKKAGYDFVDIKHCHGYLGHEFLSAMDRPGKYGGSLENRSRFLRNIVAGIRAEAPGLDIGVRLSAFDFVPFQMPEDGSQPGVPMTLNGQEYTYGFGGGTSGLSVDLTEPLAFLDLMRQLDIKLVCITAGSPYYNPHILRPAIFPPSDGYLPPEDPLLGVARQVSAVAQLKQQQPDLVYVGSGYSYLQDWLPNVAQHTVRTEQVDFVGLGRMILAYPEMPADILAGRSLQRKRICRTFSDCTTAPRNGIVSGCFPLDDFYKNSPEFELLQAAKQKQRAVLQSK